MRSRSNKLIRLAGTLASAAEFLPRYETVRAAASPEAAIAEFIESTDSHAATLADWDRAVERPCLRYTTLIASYATAEALGSGAGNWSHHESLHPALGRNRITTWNSPAFIT